MTSRTLAYPRSDESGPAWLAAAELGCDMELLAESLALSPAERLRLHTIALRRIERLEAAMQRTLPPNSGRSG